MLRYYISNVELPIHLWDYNLQETIFISSRIVNVRKLSKQYYEKEIRDFWECLNKSSYVCEFIKNST